MSFCGCLLSLVEVLLGLHWDRIGFVGICLGLVGFCGAWLGNCLGL